MLCPPPYYEVAGKYPDLGGIFTSNEYMRDRNRLKNFQLG